MIYRELHIYGTREEAIRAQANYKGLVGTAVHITRGELVGGIGAYNLVIHCGLTSKDVPWLAEQIIPRLIPRT